MATSVRRSSLVLLGAGVVALASTTLGTGTAGAATPAVTVTTVAGMGTPVSINNSGQILGYTVKGDRTNPLCVYDIYCTSYLNNAQVINGTTLTTLTRPGAKGLDATAQNDAGTVLGESLQPDGNHTDIFLGAGAAKTAVQLDGGGQLAQAEAINNAGQVLADYKSGGAVRAVIASGATVSKAATLTQIGVIGSTATNVVSAATAINATGTAVGYGTAMTGSVQKPWRFQSGVLTWLPLPAPWVSGYPEQINSSGWAIGEIIRPSTPADKTIDSDVTHIGLWRGTTFTDLGTLGGSVIGVGNSNSPNSSLNDAGQIVGTSFLAGDTTSVGFVWQNGVMTKLAAPAGFGFYPSAINAAGDVAGQIISSDNSTSSPGFLRKGVLTDLQKTSGTGGTVVAMNSTGAVLGTNGNGITIVWHVPTS